MPKTPVITTKKTCKVFPFSAYGYVATKKAPFLGENRAYVTQCIMCHIKYTYKSHGIKASKPNRTAAKLKEVPSNHTEQGKYRNYVLATLPKSKMTYTKLVDGTYAHKNNTRMIFFVKKILSALVCL